MKIAYHYHIELLKFRKNYYVSSFWGKYVTEISKRSNLIVVAWVRRVKEKPKLYSLDNRRIKVFDLGEKPSSFLKNFLRLPQFFFQIYKNKELSDIDFFGFEVPTFYAIYFWPFYRRKRFFLFLAGDLPSCIFKNRDLGIFKKLILYTYFSLDKFFLIKMCNRSVVFGENLQRFETDNNKFIDFYHHVKPKRNNLLMNTFHSKDVRQGRHVRSFSNNKKLKLITVTRIAFENSIMFIVDVARKILERNKDFEWLVIGDGPAEGSLRNEINKYNLNKNIILCGYIDHGSKFNQKLLDADIYVEPYIPNGPGPARAAWEGLSFGLPLVAGSPCKRPYLKNKNNIIFAKTNTPTDFSNAILSTWKNTNLRQRLSHNSLNIAKRRSLDKEIFNMIELLKHYEK